MATAEEKKAAANQTKISTQNVKDVKHQLARQLANYDFADRQNRKLADVQLQQASRKGSADRFEAQRNLRDATLGLLGSMGGAMNGSSTGNLMSMLRSRNDSDNNNYWAQLQENWDQIENAYNDSVNQNRVARRDAMQSAEKSIRDIGSDWSANMNNINPDLFRQGNVGGNEKLAASTAWTPKKAKMNNARLSGYVMPDQSVAGTGMQPRNQMSEGDYFGRLMNRFNGR